MEQEDKSEKIDIKKLNTEIKETVEKINKLRAQIDQIVPEVEGSKTRQIPQQIQYAFSFSALKNEAAE